VLAKPDGVPGMESSMISEPSGRYDRGGDNRPRRKASKHLTGEGGDAE